MESTGILNCPSGLKLSVAVPGHALNPFCGKFVMQPNTCKTLISFYRHATKIVVWMGGSGSGCNNENTRELGIHLDLDCPYGREGLPQQGASMEVQKGEERGGVRHNSSNHTRLSRKQKKELADRLNLRISQVDAWFRNRRLRSKQRSTEMECAYLKECFNKLKEENHRLQLKVEQLRSTSLQLQLQLHRERVVTAPTGQQAGTSAAACIFTSAWPGSNPSRRTWFSPNAL
uniref:Homeobox domain-containing protein n=1 Tax=Oryza punctata TaxID=4537 RepID=A0A0E0L635_ORYPU